MEEFWEVVFWGALAIGAIAYLGMKDKECENNGGTYLSYEMKCVTGIKEIK